MQVCVVALGKIGLPLAVQFARAGHDVIGVDISPTVVESVNAGVAHIDGEAHLAERLREVVEAGRLTATTDTTAAVSQSEVVVVVVPLVVDSNAKPHFAPLDAATRAIGDGLRPGTLVSYEVTLPVHTTRERILPTLVERSGLTPGSDLFLVHSPERVFSGRIFEDLRRYPKLVGGVDAESAKRGLEFYESALEFDDRPDLDRPNGVWDLGSAEAAELAKLAETTYRDVNIALANEFARFSDQIGVDIRSVIAACNTQPFSHIHTPGVSVGGHCIPVYPRLYLHADPAAKLPAVARAVNESMPAYAVTLLRDALGSLHGRSVAILGISYRGGVKEAAFSGAFPLRDALAEAGAEVLAHDPLYSDEEISAMGFEPYHLGDEVSAAVLHTDHLPYRTIEPADLGGAAVLVDGRNTTDRDVFAGSSTRRIVLGALGDG